MQVEVDGHSAFFSTGGQPPRPDLPAVILVHGSGSDHTFWRFQSRYLAHHGFSVMSVDLPGHGRSGGAPPESVEVSADWIRGLLDAVGRDRAAIVGHSLGALVALDAGARHPDRVSHIALFGGAAEMPVHPEMLSSAAEGTTHVLDLMRAWMHASHSGGHPDPGRWMMGESWTLQLVTGLDVLHADLMACHLYEAGAERAAQVRCPTLVVAGSSDRMVRPEASRSLAESIDDATLIVLPGGHVLPTEEPWQVTRMLRDFLGGDAPTV